VSQASAKAGIIYRTFLSNNLRYAKNNFAICSLVKKIILMLKNALSGEYS